VELCTGDSLVVIWLISKLILVLVVSTSSILIVHHITTLLTGLSIKLIWNVVWLTMLLVWTLMVHLWVSTLMVLGTTHIMRLLVLHMLSHGLLHVAVASHHSSLVAKHLGVVITNHIIVIWHSLLREEHFGVVGRIVHIGFWLIIGFYHFTTFHRVCGG